MTRVVATSCGFLLLLISSLAVPLVSGTSSEWSSEIEINMCHWMAEKSELRDLESNERYMFGLGGHNIPGGDNVIYLKSNPPGDFDIFAGDRLDITWVVEGDIIMSVVNDSDIHLIFLPVNMNGTSFFELLFLEQEILETLTHSKFVNATIETDRAIAFLKYDDILDVVYEWDTSTGMLSRKEVTAPSGLQLIVVPGQGIGFSPFYPEYLIIIVIVIIAILSLIGFAVYSFRRR